MGRTPSRLLREMAIGVGLFILGVVVSTVVLCVAGAIRPFGDVW